MMLMLCVYLYERLPQYLTKKYIEFSGPLHATVVKKVLVLLSLSLEWLLTEHTAVIWVWEYLFWIISFFLEGVNAAEILNY